jgi:hypothetical protein
LPITVAALSEAWTLKHWERGLESHSGHGCLSPFILFLLLCV